MANDPRWIEPAQDSHFRQRAQAMTERLVLNFHGIGVAPGNVPTAERQYWCRVDSFRAMLDEVSELSAGTGTSIQITFDDGNLSDATVALPALLARGMTATFFVCAGRIGQTGFVDAAALRDLLAAGMAIGSHGWNHVDWRRTDDKALQHETLGALHEISAVIGIQVDEVGVPFGSYDRRVLNQLRGGGVRTVYTSDGGRAPLAGWLVPRLSYSASWTQGTLRRAVIDPIGKFERTKRGLIRTFKQLR
jgi:peptidoglycan/xylan/chitin deacetylase (PgdA/CDA1 family)